MSRRRVLRARLARFAVVAWLAGIGVSTAQTTGWPAEMPPRALAAHDVPFPPYQLRTLPNGMQVVVVMHREQPAVNVRLIVRAGSAQDPAGKAGAAALVATLLDQGTATRTAGQIADLVDSVGGDSDTGAGRDLSYARLRVMKDSFELAMTLLADEVRNSSFADVEIERQRQQTLSALRVSYDDPEYLANIVFDRLVYGLNAYARPTNGTPDSLPAITRADLQAFHDRWYTPNNCLLAIVGDVTADEALAAASRAFGDWVRRDVRADGEVEPPQPSRRVIVVDNPNLVQTEVRVGHLGIPRKQNDYMALDLAIKILGGEGANRLHRVLRMERGLTYGASAEMETLKRAGEFVAITNTRSEATGEVLRLIVEEFNRLRVQRVNDEELADAKAYLTGNFPLRIETSDDIAMQVLNVLFYDLPVEELQTYRQRVNAVSADDIARVANSYLRPDRLAVVLVGNAKAFVNQLRAVGFDQYDVIPAADIDLTTSDLRRRATAGDGTQSVPMAAVRGPTSDVRSPNQGAGLRTSDIGLRTTNGDGAGGAPMDGEQDPAQQVLDRAIRAKGGAERLRAVRTVVMSGTTIVRSPAAIEARTTSYIAYPGRFRQDAKLPNGDVTQVVDGGDAWMIDPAGVHDLPAPERARLLSNVSRDLLSLLVRAADGRLRVRLQPTPSADADRPLDVLELSGDGLVPVDLLIDRSTGMIAGEQYVVEQPGAIGKVPTVESYSDYRAVDGIQVAFKTVVRRGAAVILERTLTDLKFNAPLDPALFARAAK